jgi:hypothetical protein
MRCVFLEVRTAFINIPLNQVYILLKYVFHVMCQYFVQ